MTISRSLSTSVSWLSTVSALVGATSFALAQEAAPEAGTPPMMQDEGMMGQGDTSGMMGMMQMMQACNEMMAAMTWQMNAPEPPAMQEGDG